jgi:drug/metabolite transporter (DMT)-like permease
MASCFYTLAALNRFRNGPSVWIMRMNRYFKERLWLVYTILASLSWGFWGVMTKFVSGDINPFVNHFLFSAGMLFTLPFILRKCKRKEVNMKGILWGIGGGILAVIGNLCVYQSFSTGGLASVVIPLSNLYPMGTILIALFVFKEKLHWMNGIGILIVVPAIIMLSGQSQIFDDPLLFFRSLGLNTWLLFALLSLFLYILFSASQKVTTHFISASWSYLSFIVSCAIGSICFMSFGLIDYHFSHKTLGIGLVAGLVDGFGVLAIFAAYRAEGKAAQVSSIAAMMQQLFTIIMALIFLKERLAWIGYTGICLAILGTLFLSVEKKKKEITNART